MRILIFLFLCYFVFCFYKVAEKASEIETKHITNIVKGNDDAPLTNHYRCTYVHEKSFETPYYRTFEKIGSEVYIQEPDTIKTKPLIISDWKVTVIEGGITKKYKSGDFEKIRNEIKELFWFKPD